MQILALGVVLLGGLVEARPTRVSGWRPHQLSVTSTVGAATGRGGAPDVDNADPNEDNTVDDTPPGVRHTPGRRTQMTPTAAHNR